MYGVNNPQKVIEINRVIKRIRNINAVDGVSFSIYKGEIFCLLGHNGAGKTTLIKMLTGLTNIDEGNVFYEGEDFEENYSKLRTQLGICPQQDVLFKKLKVREPRTDSKA